MAEDKPVSAEEQRLQRLQLLDDHIGQSLRDSEARGELRSAPSFGRPLEFGDGYDETPPELRMGMKILRDAGVVPPEIELMQRIAALQADAESCADEARARELHRRVAELRQALALRLEQLRQTGRW